MPDPSILNKQHSLANHFALWVTLLTVLIIAGLGAYFDGFLRSSFLENTRTRMAYGYERLSFNFQQVESSLREGVLFLQDDDAALASIRLINRYEDREEYNTFLLDEEKKTLARELLSRVKLSFNDDIALYGKQMDLIAYVARDSRGYYLNIVSYSSGKPQLLRRYEDELHFTPVSFDRAEEDGILYRHIDYYTQEQLNQGSIVSRHLDDRGLILKSHLRIRKQGESIAHIEMSRVMGREYFLGLSGNMNLNIELARQPFAPVTQISDLNHLQEGKRYFRVFETDERYLSSMYMETLDGRAFFNVSMAREFLNHALSQNRLHLVILLCVTALLAMLLIRYLTVKRLSVPLKALMNQLRKIQRQDYSVTRVLVSNDELQAVSESINRLAGTVADRERSLQGSKKELEYLSDHDVLTGLPNRRFWLRYLAEHLQQAGQRGQKAAVFFIDLDQFKQVNDTLGHDVGDRLLQSVAGRLQQSLAGNETLARIGGDEFNLLIENLRDSGQARETAQRLIELFHEPFQVGDQGISISASIGITLFPQDGCDSISLSKYADLAMYKAKDDGRNNYSFFTRELSARMQDRADLIHALRYALQDKQQFELYYQPKVSAFSHTIVAIEALIRWNHPVLGMVSPARFIPLAEELGLIIPLGAWVLEQGCRDFIRLQQLGYPLDHISINVSSIQLDSDSFAATVDQVLKDTGIDTNALELEITESYIAKKPEAARRRLEYFRNRGLRLAIDDFGTGYSAMNTLQNLPVTRLKIDKSFVDGLPHDSNSVALARTVVSLAKNFNLALTAEGVENKSQLAFLAAEACEEIQGYYFSKPLPFNELVNFCESNQKKTMLTSATDT